MVSFKSRMSGKAMTILLLLTSFVLASEACEIEYYKTGCYNDLPNPRTLPNLLLNARYPGAKNNPGYSVIWDIQNYQEFLPRFICDCARAVASTSAKYFGIQFYAECWSGVATPQDFARVGLSKSCVNSSFDLCQTQSKICSGTNFTNMIYYVTEKLQPNVTTGKVTTVKTSRSTSEPLPKTTESLPVTTDETTTTTEPLPTNEHRTTTTKSLITTTENPTTTSQAPKTTQLATTMAEPPTTPGEPQATTKKASPTEPATVITTKDIKTPDCMRNSDILIALDISSSISLVEFEKRKQLLADFVTRFPVNENEVHFALMHYNHNVYTDFTFSDPHFYNVPLVQKTIIKVPLLGGATLTQKALNVAFNVFFEPEHGARPTSKKILIIVTDGYTYGGETTLELPSLKLQLSGVNIVPVGFGKRTNLVGLSVISNNALTLDDILPKTGGELLEYLDTLIDVVCE